MGRFSTIDRFAEKYYSMNPYQYGANNPISNIDVNGDSIIVMSASQSVAPGVGHAAVLIGNNDDGWRFYSKNGTTKAPGSKGPSDHDAEGKPFDSIESFANSDQNINDDGTQIYTEGYMLSSDSETDEIMKDAAQNSLNQSYNVLCDNCMDMVSDALEAGGFDGGNSTTNYPSSTTGMIESKTSKSPIPNIRYRKVKSNNPNGTIINSGQLKPSAQNSRNKIREVATSNRIRRNERRTIRDQKPNSPSGGSRRR